MFRVTRLFGAAIPGLALSLLTALAGPVRPDGTPVDLLGNPEAKAVVLVFVAEDCPISNRYVPLLNQLFRTYSERGIEIWSIYANPGVTAETLRKHRDDFEIEFPAVIDAEQTLVKKFGAEVTPEVFVLVPDKAPSAEPRLVYKGRIDNQYLNFGKWRPSATKSDLEEVLEVIAAGHVPDFRETRAVGCYIVTS